MQTCSTQVPGCGGGYMEGEEFEESMAKIRFKCKKIVGLALPQGVKSQVDTAVDLYNVATIVYLPKKMLQQIGIEYHLVDHQHGGGCRW